MWPGGWRTSGFLVSWHAHVSGIPAQTVNQLGQDIMRDLGTGCSIFTIILIAGLNANSKCYWPCRTSNKTLLGLDNAIKTALALWDLPMLTRPCLKISLMFVSGPVILMKITLIILTLMLLVTDFDLNNTKWCKKHFKMTETLAHGYSSESTQ